MSSILMYGRNMMVWVDETGCSRKDFFGSMDIVTRVIKPGVTASYKRPENKLYGSTIFSGNSGCRAYLQ